VTTAATSRLRAELLAPGLALINAALFSYLAFSQWVAWGGPTALRSAGAGPVEVAAWCLYVLGINLAVSTGCVLLYFRIPGASGHGGWLRRLIIASGLALGTATVRAVALEPVGDPVGLTDDVVDGVSAVVSQVVAVAASLMVVDLVARARHEARLRDEHERDAARHAAELEQADALRRRMVADRLHGRLQNRLALICAGVDDVAAELTASDAPAARRLRDLADLLDEVREDDVRALSHEVLPTALDVSLVRALRTLLDRLPPSLSGQLVVEAGYEARTSPQGDEIVDLATRALVVDTVEEGLTNAVKHGGARRAEIHLDALEAVDGTTRLLVRVVDHGHGLTQDAPEWNGLRRHAARLQLRGGSLRLEGHPDGAALVIDVPLHPGAEPDPGAPPQHGFDGTTASTQEDG
jgi:signal transduction histidine kinase